MYIYRYIYIDMYENTFINKYILFVPPVPGLRYLVHIEVETPL